MNESTLSKFQELIDIRFKDDSLLQKALTHSSFTAENPGMANNERLEFLGDAILDFIIGEVLYYKFPGFDEGQLSYLRSLLVKSDTLSLVAKTIKIGDFLSLGKGEEATGGREKRANLEGALEALIGAVYLDRGFEETRFLVNRLFEDEIEKVSGKSISIDHKSKLQEIIQAKHHCIPEYSIIDVQGPEHEREFTAEVSLLDKVIGTGSGKTKKAAEAEAARSALEKLR